MKTIIKQIKDLDNETKELILKEFDAEEKDYIKFKFTKTRVDIEVVKQSV